MVAAPETNTPSWDSVFHFIILLHIKTQTLQIITVLCVPVFLSVCLHLWHISVLLFPHQLYHKPKFNQYMPSTVNWLLLKRSAFTKYDINISIILKHPFFLYSIVRVIIQLGEDNEILSRLSAPCIHRLLHYQHHSPQWYINYNWWTCANMPWPKFVVSLEFPLAVTCSYVSWQMCNDMEPPLWFHTEYFTLPKKLLVIHLVITLSSLTPGKHWYFAVSIVFAFPKYHIVGII